MASIYGTVIRSDGSKVDRTMKITNSWDSNYAIPRDGEYELELNGNPNGKVTVYVDGMTYRTVYVDGSARLDIRL